MASSDTPSRRHSKERRRSRSTDEARVFKKPVQFVGRPPVTDHNISDDYMRNPPQNFDPSLAEAWTAAESEGPTERQMRAEERAAANLRATEKEEREEREAREAREAEVEKERTRSPGRLRRKEKSKSKAATPLLPEEVQEGGYQKPSDRVLLPEEETRILD